jgi:hypothetical protein
VETSGEVLVEETDLASFYVVDGTHDLQFAVCLGFLQELTVLNDLDHLITDESFDGVIQLIFFG